MKRALLAVAAAVACLAPVRPLGANLEIAPVRVELGPEAPTAIVTVRNGGATPMRYQVSAMAWTEPSAGETKLVPSTALAAYPPLFTLAPGDERKIRVGATVPPGPEERAWRLFVEELPSALDAPEKGAQIRVLTRFAIPVFLAPTRPAPAAALSLVYEGKVLKVLVRNTGNVHVRPTAIVVSLRDAGGAEVHRAEVTPQVLLPLAERASDVPVPQGACAAARSATAVAQLPDRKLNAALSLPGGGCGP